ncbi:hypothetical protein [Guyparkeria sp. SB14A]|nr:hypothetical protein [Guyparkeria sp. SB14A]
MKITPTHKSGLVASAIACGLILGAISPVMAENDELIDAMEG